MRKSLFAAAVIALALCGPLAAVPTQASAMPDTIEAKDLFRMYNPYSGEHFYTASYVERDNLRLVGWYEEGTGWKAPLSGDPVYRLYNPYVPGGDHHYTMDKNEYNKLAEVGWRQEGVVFYSDTNKTVPLLREYNPYAVTGTHNYTTSQKEHDSLIAVGWRDEQTAWYAVAEGRTADFDYSAYTHPDHVHQVEEKGSLFTMWIEEPQSEQVLVTMRPVPGGISRPLDPSEYYYGQSVISGTGRQQEYLVKQQICDICGTVFSSRIVRPFNSMNDIW